MKYYFLNYCIKFIEKCFSTIKLRFDLKYAVKIGGINYFIYNNIYI